MVFCLIKIYNYALTGDKIVIAPEGGVSIDLLKNRLRDIRVYEYGMESTEFARYLGINIKTYDHYEKDYTAPKLRVAIRIAGKLGRDVEQIWYLS